MKYRFIWFVLFEKYNNGSILTFFLSLGPDLSVKLIENRAVSIGFLNSIFG